MAIFNKNDYNILSVLLENKCFTEIGSLTIKQISNLTGLSIPKIRLVMKTFLLTELTKEGARDGISKSFYITEEGVDFLNKAMYPNKKDGEE